MLNNIEFKINITLKMCNLRLIQRMYIHTVEKLLLAVTSLKMSYDLSDKLLLLFLLSLLHTIESSSQCFLQSAKTYSTMVTGI